MVKSYNLRLKRLYMHKKINTLFFMLTLLIFTGCGVKHLSTDGLTLKIDESELNDKFDDFPIEKNYIFANIKVEKPKLFIKKGSNKISASMNTFISAIMIPQKSGSFIISGTPHFDKETRSIYLQNINVEKFKISGTLITKELANTLLSNLKPLIDNIFKSFPIYKIEKSSFLGNQVKDIKIKNSELLVTFGL